MLNGLKHTLLYISNVYHFVGEDGTDASGEHIDFPSNYVSLIQLAERSHLFEAGLRFIVADHDSLSIVLIRRTYRRPTSNATMAVSHGV